MVDVKVPVDVDAGEKKKKSKKRKSEVAEVCRVLFPFERDVVHFIVIDMVCQHRSRKMLRLW